LKWLTIHFSNLPGLFSFRRGKMYLFHGLADRPPDAYLTIVDPEIEAALRIGTHPRLVSDRCTLPTVIRKRNKNTVMTFPTFRE